MSTEPGQAGEPHDRAPWPEDEAPMSAASARLASAQVTADGLHVLVSHLEGAALVLRHAGLRVDPIKLIRWVFLGATSGDDPWSPQRVPLLDHLRASAWELLHHRADRMADVFAVMSGLPRNAIHLSSAQIGSLDGLMDAARRLADAMPLVRANDARCRSLAEGLCDWMRLDLARIVEGTPVDAVELAAIGLEGADCGVTDAHP